MSPGGPARSSVLAGAVVVALLLGACGGSSISSAAPATGAGSVVVLGSSTAAGVGASAGYGWTARLTTDLAERRVVLHSLARSGSLTYQVLPAGTVPPAGRPAPDPAINVDHALTLGPQLLILAFPSNDAVAGYGADETVANLETMRQAGRAGGAAALVLSSQPRDGLPPTAADALTEMDRQLAARWGDCYVDIHTSLARPGGGIDPAYSAGDGVHLNDAGHGVVLRLVRAALDGGRCVRLVSG